MKLITPIIISLGIFIFYYPANAQVQFEISEGIYRIPYNDGTIESPSVSVLIISILHSRFVIAESVKCER